MERTHLLVYDVHDIQCKLLEHEPLAYSKRNKLSELSYNNRSRLAIFIINDSMFKMKAVLIFVNE